MNINFELYKIFYTVAISGSISGGALKLNISQPAVTSSIKTLEAELGGKLFIRTPKGVVLTNEGKELFDYIKEGMNYFINGTNKFMSYKNLDEGSINIGATTIVSENYLMLYIKKFHELYPNIQINITNDLTSNLLKELRNGNLDIVISAIPNSEIKDLDINYLMDLHDIFVGDIKYKDMEKINIEELLKNDILIQKNPSITRVNFDKFLKDNNLSCTPKMEVVSHNLLAKFVISGFGIGILTKEFICSLLNNDLFEITTTIDIPVRKLGYIIKKDRVVSFATKEFINLLKD